MIQAGFNKSQLQCRNRYHNKLNPNLKSDEWSKKEIQNIFRFYDQYGSKWNFIETVIPGRTQNNIKNRFFSTLKNLLRKLLKKFTDPENQNCLKYISSRDVTDLYQGRGKYKRFKGFIKKILRRINFEIDFKAINPIMEENEEALKELFFYFIDKEDPKISEKTEGTSKVKTQSQQQNKVEETLIENQANSMSNNVTTFYPQNFTYPQMNYFGCFPTPMILPTQGNYLLMTTFPQDTFESQQNTLMWNSNLKIPSTGVYSQPSSP